MDFLSALTLLFPIGIFAIGCFLIYSAFSGKGITEPDQNAFFQLHAQYKLRGLIGVGFVIGSVLFFIEIIREVF
ncbi:MAG: hypothetical protein SWH54_06205 [Thermodesulfobacteriota bacterium]|nr:hypothetical protein [Thermodesulfobacteriota bacterium]